MKKKGWVKSKGFEDSCPFGLPITHACKHAGKSTLRMCPLDYTDEEDKKKEIEKANKKVYIYHKTGKRCPFAINIMGKDVVNCDWGDAGQGVGGAELTGSPLYPRTFSATGLEGLYGFPLGFYADNNQSRNMPYGLFSLLGRKDEEDIEKKGNK